MKVQDASSSTRGGLWRSRWAAIGAAVAVTFGGGGLFAVTAASPESSVVAIEPVRILDTRTDVGLPGPFVSAVAQDLKVTGEIPVAPSGTRIVVPVGATGVFLNVTPVSSTAGGFISVRPANAPGLPTTSNVNFTIGEINPNAVLVELPVGGADDGRIEITFDAFGAAGPITEVLVDVVGYTTDSRAYVDEQIADGPEVLGLHTGTETVPAAQGLGLNLAFTTNRASRLAVSMTGGLGLECNSSGNRYVWLAIDGVALPNSLIISGDHTDLLFTANEVESLTLTGVTTTAISAGAHTLQMRNACGTGISSASLSRLSYSGTVTYISDAAPLGASLTLDSPMVDASGGPAGEEPACPGVLSADGATCTLDGPG